MMDTKTIFFAVRHGEIENPEEVVYGRLPGFPLSSLGRNQAQRVALFLASQMPDVILTSPLLRATQTAEHVANVTSLKPICDDRLSERNVGSWEGKKMSELFSTGYQERDEDSPGGLEFSKQVAERMMAVTDDCLDRFLGKKIVFVSHKDPIAIWIFHLRGQPVRDLTTFFFLKGSVYRVEFLNRSFLNAELVFTGQGD